MEFYLSAAVVGIAGTSLVLSPRTNSVDTFYLGHSPAGGPPSLLTLTLSQVTTWIFARSLLNAAILGYFFGLPGTLAYAAYYLSFLTGGWIVDGIRFRHGFESVQSFLAARFGLAGVACYNMLIAVRLVSEVFANLLVVGLLFGADGSLAYVVAVVAIAGVAFVYSVRGGLHASLRTDVLKMVLFLVTLVVLVAVATGSGVLAPSAFTLGPLQDAGPGWVLLAVALLQVWSYPLHDPVMMDRGFVADRRTTRLSFYHAAWLSIVSVVAFGSLGVVAGHQRLGDENLVATLTRLLGDPSMLLFNIALIISAMSTLDSAFASAAKLSVVDMRLLPPGVASGRLAMAVFLIAGLVLVVRQPGSVQRRRGQRHRGAVSGAGHRLFHLGAAGHSGVELPRVVRHRADRRRPLLCRGIGLRRHPPAADRPRAQILEAAADHGPCLGVRFGGVRRRLGAARQPPDVSTMTAPRRDDTLDLGALEPPVLVFGGPYSCLHATEALRAAADRLRIPPDRTLCTGDVVAYGGDPEETTALIRDWGVHVVRGNCEDSLAAAADTCGCGFPEDSACDRLSREWYGFALDALSSSSKAWMGSLPGCIRFNLGGVRVAAIHASVDDPGRFIFASTEIASKCSELIRLEADMVIAGHSGLPFAQPIDGRLWLNAGVIGQPANDGTPDGWYSLIDVADGRLNVRFCRLSYDHRAAAATMRARGLPDAYADALITGLWPSCEILPPAEAAARGRPLTVDREPLTFRLKTDNDGRTARGSGRRRRPRPQADVF